ncbi:MAG: sensor histidine kinase [Catenulisporales bacterium]|nr:sensor histidine kinase [Catenulisporales bacterium]
MRGTEVMGVRGELDIEMSNPRVGKPGRYKWLIAAIWLIYLIDPLIKVVHSGHTPQWKLLNYTLLAAFAGMYTTLSFLVFPRDGRVGTPVRTSRGSFPLLGSMAVIATATTLWVNADFAGMWIYVGTGTGLALSLDQKRAVRGVLTVLGAMTVCVILSADATASDWLMLAIPTFFAGMSTIGIRQLALLIGQLNEARQKIAHLAANEERLRLARDLHDLTGHSLSMITLKAELAQRMLTKARDASPDGSLLGVDTALKEVAEIEQVSRQTLTDIRQAVSGYRRPTFPVEMASAYTALEAADIKLDADPAVAATTGEIHPESEAALAWSLREAVTNAIRHSGATRVRVTLERADGEMILTVRNNGRGLATAISSTDAFGGNGLAGLRERLDAVGGRLAVGGPDGDFRLVAAAPVGGSVGGGR